MNKEEGCEHGDYKILEPNYYKLDDGRSMKLVMCEYCRVLLAHDQWCLCNACAKLEKELNK